MRSLLLVLLLIATLLGGPWPGGSAQEDGPATVVYEWPHALVDADNKTALVRWAMDTAPGRYEWGVVASRSTFFTQIVDDETARALLKDPDFGVHQRTMRMTPVYGPDPAQCAPASGRHVDGEFVVFDDGCDGVPDTLRGGIIAADQRPSYVMGGRGLDWWPERGTYHVGTDVMAGMLPFFEAVGLSRVETLDVSHSAPLPELRLPSVQPQWPGPAFACECMTYTLAPSGPFAFLESVSLTLDENDDLVRAFIGPRIDWDKTPLLPQDKLDEGIASFATEHDLVVDRVSPWVLDRTTGGLNRSVHFTHAGFWEYDGRVSAAQQAHDGAFVIREWYEPSGLAHVSPRAMTIVVVLAASLLVFWGWRT